MRTHGSPVRPGTQTVQPARCFYKGGFSLWPALCAGWNGRAWPDGRDASALTASLVPHVVLLGDSIFDNAAYVRGGPDVVAHLAAALPPGWSAALAAVDGAVIADVPRQLARVPAGATHLVVSAGGNDALRHADLLERRAQSSPQVLGWLADARDAFEAGYRALLAAVLDRGLPTAVCTIYNGNLGPPADRPASVALAVFNDAILRLAAEHRVAAVELRLVCTEPGDYANPIEPSVQGGAKIARAIARALGAIPGADGAARLHAG